jgi:hypothetical protein
MNPDKAKKIRSENVIDENETTEKPSILLQKTKGYIGLILISSIAGVLLSPTSTRTELSYAVFESGYIYKTKLTVPLGENWRVPFVQKSRIYNIKCSVLQKSDSNLKDGSVKKPYEWADAECKTPGYQIYKSEKAFDMAFQAEPDIVALTDKFAELREDAVRDQKIPASYAPQYTPEMLEVRQRLVDVMKPIAERAIGWLLLVNVMAHLAVVLLAALGIWYRHAIGTVVLAPFGWIFSLGKGIHRKI